MSSILSKPAFTQSGITLVAGFLLAGCQLLPVAQIPAYAHSHYAQDDLDQSQLMYEIMIAELAGRRGMLDIASEGYFAASKRTDDPRVSERATRLAVWSRAWVQAEEVGIRWAELDPQNPEVRQMLAQIHLRQGDSAAAADQLVKLIELNKDSDSLQKTMLEIYNVLAREPNRTVAVESMTELRDRFPNDSYANLVLAQLSFGANDRETALSAVDQAIEIDSSNTEARLLRARILSSAGDVEKGFAELATAVAEQPDNLELRLGYARQLVEAERYEQASGELESIFERDSDNADALLTISLLALESKRTEPAERYLTRLLDLDKHRSEAHFYLGRIADNRLDYEVAIEHYENVSSGEGYLDAQIRAAELYGQTGQVSIGRERLQQLAMQHNEPELKPRLVRAEGRILQQAGEPEQAVMVLSAGVEQFPENTDLLYARALAADAAKDPAMFRSDLLKLIELNPDNAHAMNALGYYYADKNINLNEAEKYLERAYELMPDDAAIIDSLGWLRYRQGDHEAAISLLRKAYKLLPDPEIAAHLGEVLWITGEQESAKDIWSRALADRPDHKKLQSVMERFVQ